MRETKESRESFRFLTIIELQLGMWEYNSLSNNRRRRRRRSRFEVVGEKIELVFGMINVTA